MPDGRDGGRGGNPFSRATSSRNAWFSARSATIVACCASTLACRAALSECSRRTSPTRRPTTSRRSASDNLSSDAASRNDMQKVNHVSALSATAPPGNLPRLPRLVLPRDPARETARAPCPPGHSHQRLVSQEAPNLLRHARRRPPGHLARTGFRHVPPRNRHAQTPASTPGRHNPRAMPRCMMAKVELINEGTSGAGSESEAYADVDDSRVQVNSGFPSRAGCGLRDKEACVRVRQYLLEVKIETCMLREIQIGSGYERRTKSI